ncbi:helix-turn-helix transcriptional regulator [Dactylosporangium sp. NPDC049140]|uniref:helix-turn-helix transcriptional regulator n=1 Tax=Dactylosporangium sp. NPDC049140 TaxID=3155647 RepID=UPI0033C7A601
MVVASTVQKVRLRARDDDLAAATALLAGAVEGHGGALVLAGPPGIGRTALLAALSEAAGPATDAPGASAVTVLAVTGCHAESALPLAALHRLLAGLRYPAEPHRGPGTDPHRGLGPDPHRGPGPDPHRGLGPDLHRGPGPDPHRGLGPDLHRGPGPDPHRGLGPDLHRGLGPDPHRGPGPDRLAAGLAVLAALRRAAPVLVLVDDAHALDRPSLDALAVAARRAGRERIALVFALRDAPGAAAAEAALAGLPRRRLGPLDRRESRYLLTDAVPGLAGDVAGVLAARAGGNPRALAELAAALSGEQRRGEAAPPSTPLREGGLRREYRAVLRTLPPPTRQALILAAAAARVTADGTSCPAALLPAAGHPPADLAPAEHAELIQVEDGRARFVPPLFAEVVYAEADLAERHAAHRRLAALAPDRREAALHRAATATGPDDALATELATAAGAHTPATTATAAGAHTPATTATTATAAAHTPATTATATAATSAAATRAATTAASAPIAAPTPATAEADTPAAARAEARTPAATGDDPVTAPPAAAEALRGGEAAGGDPIGVAALERAAELTTDPAKAAAWTLGAARLAWRGGEPHRARLLLRAVFAPAVPPALHAERELLLGEVELRTGAHGDALHTLLAAAARLPGRRALRALVLAGEALGAAGRHDRYAEVARRAVLLRAGPPPTPDEELLFEQLAGVAAGYAGDPAAAAGPLRRAVALAEGSADPAALVRAAWAGIVAGRDEDAHRLAVRAGRLARGVGDRAIEPLAHEVAATAALALGDLDLAAATAGEGLRLAAATGQDAVADNCCGLLAVMAGMLGDGEGCRHWVRRCRARAGGDVDSQARAMCVWAASLVDVADGRHADAAGRLWGVMRTAVGRGHLGVQVPAIPTLVEAVVRGGDHGPAHQVLAAYDLWATATANPTWLALSARCHGLLAGGDDEADAHFREALRLHLAGDSAFPGARTELLYGEELRRRRRPAAAREHLRSALATFERYDAGPWVRRAAAELRAAGDHVEPAGAAVGPALTAQQARIARLVAGGATNREIAAALFVSPRTVDHHLRNIFVRLGVRSRTELARVMS